MKNVFITSLESSIWFYLIQKRSSLDFFNFYFLSFLQIYYKSGISHQAISPSLFFFQNKSFFSQIFHSESIRCFEFRAYKRRRLVENPGWKFRMGRRILRKKIYFFQPLTDTWVRNLYWYWIEKSFI